MNDKTVIFERGDKLYLVAPVAPFEPGDSEMQEFAFAEAMRQQAPNKNLLWLRGQYVEADKPNANGALWTSDELAIKSLTPRFMPVTVMHDPTTAVGLIADTKLLTREAANVPRSRIDTTLGIWAHRFPEVAEEVMENYKQGALMQSMECIKSYYDCGECDQRFPCLPNGAEKANWCSHLRGEGNQAPIRRLGNVTFTGTGLIYGTRGARGALDSAHLDVFQDEVAEFHERAHVRARPKRRPRRMDTIEIERAEYDKLNLAASRVDELEKKVPALEETAAKVPQLEAQVEETETAKVAAETERDELQKKVEKAEETERATALSKDRLDKLGKGFTTKLGDFTRGRLEEQAGKLKDDEWDERLKELEEVAGVKRDEGGEPSEDDEKDVLTREETARSRAGGGGGGNNGSAPSATKRRSVVAGLAKIGNK